MLLHKILVSKNEITAPDFKKSKHGITVSLCSNAIGIHNQPLIVISKSAQLRAFKNINMKNFLVYYRSSRTAWINQELYKEVVSFSVYSIYHKTIKRKKLAVYGTFFTRQ